VPLRLCVLRFTQLLPMLSLRIAHCTGGFANPLGRYRTPVGAVPTVAQWGRSLPYLPWGRSLPYPQWGRPLPYPSGGGPYCTSRGDVPTVPPVGAAPTVPPVGAVPTVPPSGDACALHCDTGFDSLCLRLIIVMTFCVPFVSCIFRVTTLVILAGAGRRL